MAERQDDSDHHKHLDEHQGQQQGRREQPPPPPPQQQAAPDDDEEARLPDAAPILSLLNGFRRSKVLFALVGLGVPDALAERGAAGPVGVAALARTLAAGAGGAPPGPEPCHDGLGRLLDAAVSLGLLSGSRAEGYRLNDLSRVYLRRGSEYSLTGYIAHSDALLYKLWGELETAVVTGRNCWQPAFGLDSADVFASMYSSDEAVLRFMRGMHGFSKLSARRVLTAFDLSGFSTLVDLGGATGALAAAACVAYPRMRAVVFDLPHVVAKAQAHFAQAPAARAAGGRLSWAGGDFFAEPEAPGGAPPLPRGDLYVLSRILHDWEEARCFKLLRTIYELLPVGGALLICEMLLDERGTSPPEVLLQSLNMLAQTHGRERRLSEYAHMLETAGFRRIQGKRTGTYLDAVIGYKTSRRGGEGGDGDGDGEEEEGERGGPPPPPPLGSG